MKFPKQINDRNDRDTLTVAVDPSDGAGTVDVRGCYGDDFRGCWILEADEARRLAKALKKAADKLDALLA